MNAITKEICTGTIEHGRYTTEVKDNNNDGHLFVTKQVKVKFSIINGEEGPIHYYSTAPRLQNCEQAKEDCE